MTDRVSQNERGFRPTIRVNERGEDGNIFSLMNLIEAAHRQLGYEGWWGEMNGMRVCVSNNRWPRSREILDDYAEIIDTSAIA